MIGIQLAGKNNRISASSFARSFNSFLDLLKDVDSLISQRPKGSVRWELATLQKNSPALVEVAGVSRIKEMDFTHAIQESVLDGIEQLATGPEQPQFYSFSALRKLLQMADQSKHLMWMTVFAGTRRTLLTDRISNNVAYLITSGSKSLASVRGSLDAIIVHSGYEFRIWSPKWKRPTVCHFDRSILDDVSAHLKQEVEVIGELHRNQEGEPVRMNVEKFIPLAAAVTTPRISEMRGALSGIYGGKSLKGYLEELRNG